MNPAIRAYLAWVKAGRPGPNPQGELFDAQSFREPEAVRARRRERPRFRRRRR